MAAPSKLPLPIKALAALATIPANVFCNYLANIMAGGWTAMQAVDSRTFVAAAAVAGLFGWIRHLTNRDEKEREQLARAIRAIKCDARTASDLIEGIATGRIEVSFTIDELMKSEIEDACRRIVAAPISGLSDRDATTILDALYRSASRQQLESLKSEFDDYREVSEMLSWTLDHRTREQGTILLNIQKLVAEVAAQCPVLISIEQKIDAIVQSTARMDTTLQRVAEILEQRTNETEKQIVARLRPVIEKEVDAKKQAEFEQQRRNTDETVAILIKSVLRAANVPGLIGELRKTGDARKIFEALRQVSTYSDADYIEVHRGIAEWAFLTGVIAEAERSLKNILHVLPNDLDALTRVGFIHDLRGKLSAAEKCYQEVLRLAGADESWQAAAFGNLGNVYKRRGDLDGAEQMYKKALAIDEKLSRLEGIADNYGNLGVLCYTRGDLDGAEELYKKALAIDEKLGRPVGMADAYGNFGVVCCSRGDLDGAEEMFKKALAINEKLGRPVGMAVDYGNLGNIYYTRSDLDEAEAMYKKALPINEKLDRLEGIADNYTGIGNVYVRRGDLDGAEDKYKKSLEINKKLDRPEGMALDYGNLGIVYFTRGDLDKAEGMYKKALAIDEKLGRPEGMARQYYNLGILNEKRGDRNAAREGWTKARDFYQKAQMPHMAKKMQDGLNSLPPTGASPPAP